jgi:hypothetical protein
MVFGLTTSSEAPCGVRWPSCHPPLQKAVHVYPQLDIKGASICCRGRGYVSTATKQGPGGTCHFSLRFTSVDPMHLLPVFAARSCRLRRGRASRAAGLPRAVEFWLVARYVVISGAGGTGVSKSHIGRAPPTTEHLRVRDRAVRGAVSASRERNCPVES